MQKNHNRNRLLYCRASPPQSNDSKFALHIYFFHTKITDTGYYKKIKKLYVQYPKFVMKPLKWKRLRTIQLIKEGRLWSV